MARTGLRFRPPPLRITPEIRWVLLRAYGPLDADGPNELEPDAALGLAFDLGLASRIGSRLLERRLEQELGPGVASQLVDERMAAAGLGLRLGASVRCLATIAGEAEIPLALLKFSALQAAGVLRPGSRRANDIDLLATESLAPRLQRRLEATGFEASDRPTTEQHLPLLSHPELGLVEVHFRILGVRPEPASRSITFEALRQASLLAPHPELPACHIPATEILAAHALVHGIAHHGFSPSAYWMAWMVSDLIDLGLAADGGEELQRRAHAWIAGDVSSEETDAARGLCNHLVRATPLEEWVESPAGLLLRHVVAGAVEPDYEESLKAKALLVPVSDLPRPMAVGRFVWKSLVPGRGQLAQIYGRGTRSESLARRLWRPFDLIGRLARVGLGNLRLRWRRRSMRSSGERGSNGC